VRIEIRDGTGEIDILARLLRSREALDEFGQIGSTDTKLLPHEAGAAANRAKGDLWIPWLGRIADLVDAGMPEKGAKKRVWLEIVYCYIVKAGGVAAMPAWIPSDVPQDLLFFDLPEISDAVGRSGKIPSSLDRRWREYKTSSPIDA